MLTNRPRDLRKRQSVRAQRRLGNLDRDLERFHATEFDVGDTVELQELVAHAFADIAQRAFVQLARDRECHHVAAILRERDRRTFGLFGERDDAIDRALHVLQRAVLVCGQLQFDAHRPATLAGRRGHASDPLDAVHLVLDREEDPLFDLLRTRAGVRDADGDDVDRELGKDLLRDARREERTADDERDHQQVRGDGVRGHPRDRSGRTLPAGRTRRRRVASGARTRVAIGAHASSPAGASVPGVRTLTRAPSSSAKRRSF